MLRFEDNHRKNCHKAESAENDPKNFSASVVAFSFFEGVTAVARIVSRTIMRFYFEKLVEPSEYFFRIESDKSGVRNNEAANKRLRRKLAIVVAFDHDQNAGIDLRCRCDLFKSNA